VLPIGNSFSAAGPATPQSRPLDVADGQHHLVAILQPVVFNRLYRHFLATFRGRDARSGRYLRHGAMGGAAAGRDCGSRAGPPPRGGSFATGDPAGGADCGSSLNTRLSANPWRLRPGADLGPAGPPPDRLPGRAAAGRVRSRRRRWRRPD